MLHRRFMMQQSGGGESGDSFSILLNFQNEATKNVVTVTPTSSSYTIGKYGIGFCFYAEPDMNATEVSCTIKVTTPSNNSYIYTSSNILLDDYNIIDGYRGKSVCVFCSITNGNTTSIDNLTFASDLFYHYEERTFMDPNIQRGGSIPSNLASIGCGSGTDISSPRYQYQLKGNCPLENGDYRFDVSLSGTLPSQITVSNIGTDNTITENKATTHASCATHSKSQWIKGSSIFIDNMFKEDGTI